ncbi:cytochrome c3 family protein [Amorphus sp. 3PC139-8]|uniref:cytochrome c3 family protein n=1 Tax=Amorphus sp. 3PC139-8 TaxID=2735676 RepID=UPI00345CC13A
MPQIFSPKADGLARLTIWGVAIAVVVALGVTFLLMRSPYATAVGLVRDQPVPFSHKHHVGGLGLDCRYCHASVETSAFAGVPETEVCMTCHSQLWTDADVLEPVRESWATGAPIRWQRVNSLPDYAYFDHSVHVAKGVPCEACHGRVDQMPLTRKAEPLTMSFCVDCHRDPAKRLRPKSAVFAMGWSTKKSRAELGHYLMKANGIQTETLTDCSTCHR